MDLTERILQLHGASGSGEILFRNRLTRDQIRESMSLHPPSCVVSEACRISNYWAREIQALGRDMRLIAPQYGKSFVERQKNDPNDAEAIVIAAHQPAMRFVSPKSEEQQARAAIFRARERLVRQWTELANAVRAVLYEYGAVFPVGLSQIKRIEVHINSADAELPALLVAECQDLLLQISEQTAQIDTQKKLRARVAACSETARRFQAMHPLAHVGMRCQQAGVGPMTALAVEAFAPPITEFRRGRDFAAWRGVVPRQYSSVGKERLGRFSNAGLMDIRCLLTIGAMCRVIW